MTSNIPGIGYRTANDLYEITETSWQDDGVLRVTVREMIGEREIPPARLRAMRALARRAANGRIVPRSARTLRTWYAGGQSHATFAVSRLPR